MSGRGQIDEAEVIQSLAIVRGRRQCWRDRGAMEATFGLMRIILS
jgi:hypothetical protein